MSPPTNESLDAELATVPPVQWPARCWFEASRRSRTSAIATMPEWEAAALGRARRATGKGHGRFSAPDAGNDVPVQRPRAFQPEDAAFFFGREVLVDELVARLHAVPDARDRRPLRKRQVLARTGGALPQQLAVRRLAREPALADPIFTPGVDPIEGARASARIRSPSTRRRAATELRDDPRVRPAVLLLADSRSARHRPVRRALHPRRRRCRSARVPRCVATLAASQDASVRVVLGLRSDFYRRAAHFPGSRTASATTRSWSARCGVTS